MKKLFFAILLLSSMWATFSQATEENWVPFISDTGLFEVTLPTTPELSSVQRAEYTAYSVSASNNKVEYRIVYSIQAQQLSTTDQAQFINNSKDIYINAQKGKLKSEKEFMVGENQGKEIKFITDNKEYIHYRIFFNQNILYTLYVISDGQFAPKNETDKFLSSFKLKDSPLPQNQAESGHDSTPAAPQKKDD